MERIRYVDLMISYMVMFHKRNHILLSDVRSMLINHNIFFFSWKRTKTKKKQKKLDVVIMIISFIQFLKTVTSEFEFLLLL